MDNSPNSPPLSVVPKGERQDAGDWGVHGNEYIDVASGDFNGDGVVEAVAAWEGPSDSINLVMPAIISRTLQWSSAVRLNLPSRGPIREVHLATGDFDADVQDEFVLAYYRLVGTLGETEVDAGVLPARGSATVDMAWQVPLDFDVENQEIWAVVDPDNEITSEVHENNNKGFTVLGTRSVSVPGSGNLVHLPLIVRIN